MVIVHTPNLYAFLFFIDISSFSLKQSNFCAYFEKIDQLCQEIPFIIINIGKISIKHGIKAHHGEKL